MEKQENIIELKHISRTFTDGFKAVSDFNLEVKRGEFVTFLGPSGCGKTTTLRMIAGFDLPTEGDILLNGKDINETKKTAAAARFRVGLCFQYPEYQLFGETCAADIGFGPKNMGLAPDEIRARVQKAAAIVGLPSEKLESSPFDLSGGQKRRCAIAGVIAMEPEILILDEPTAGLDPVGREEILDMIRRCRAEQGATIMIVTHSMEIAASISDRILVLNKGKLHLSGTPQEVFADTQKLHEIGLDVPSYTRILRALRDKGFDLPDAYTLPDAAKLLCRLLKEGGRT